MSSGKRALACPALHPCNHSRKQVGAQLRGKIGKSAPALLQLPTGVQLLIDFVGCDDLQHAWRPVACRSACCKTSVAGWQQWQGCGGVCVWTVTFWTACLRLLLSVLVSQLVSVTSVGSGMQRAACPAPMVVTTHPLTRKGGTGVAVSTMPARSSVSRSNLNTLIFSRMPSGRGQGCRCLNLASANKGPMLGMCSTPSAHQGRAPRLQPCHAAHTPGSIGLDSFVATSLRYVAASL